MVLALGDNFYGSGIHGDDSDPRFEETFESVYSDKSLQVPWYVLAGNHDHMANVTAQIAYSNDSKRWNFPSLYYNFTKTFTSHGETLTAEFVMIDTVVLSGLSYHDEENDIFVKAKGPESPRKSDEQMKWLEHVLNHSTADYLFVAGHYPVYSVCSHGPTSHLIHHVQPLLEKYDVTGFLSGHDHCQSYVQEDDKTFHALTGAGHYCCYTASNLHNSKIPKNSVKYYLSHNNNPEHSKAGFGAYHMNADNVDITFYNEKGDALFTASKNRRRPRRNKVEKQDVILK